MNTVVELNLPGLDQLVSEENRVRANLLLCERFKNLMEPYVPKDTGSLRGNVDISGQEITYTVDYAVYPYNMIGANFSEPGTSGFWDERCKEEHMEELTQFAADALMGVL